MVRLDDSVLKVGVTNEVDATRDECKQQLNFIQQTTPFIVAVMAIDLVLIAMFLG